MAQLGYISRRISVDTVPAPGTRVQILLPNGTPARLYSDSAGHNLISATGYITADSNAMVRCFVVDGVVYSMRVLAPDNSVQVTAENITPGVMVNSGQAYVSGVADSTLLSPDQAPLWPVGVPVFLPDGTLVDLNGDPVALSALDRAYSEIQVNGVSQAAAFQSLNFTGGGATVTATGMDIEVHIPDASVDVKANGVTVVPDATSLNFTGSGVTVTGTGSSATVNVSIPASLQVTDESTPVTTGATEIRFVGGGVTAAAVGTVATVTVPSTPVALHRADNTLVEADVRKVTLGGVLTATPGAATEVVLSAPDQSVAVKDEGISLVTAAKSFDFIGDGVTVTETTPGHVAVTVPAVPVAVQSEGVPLTVRAKTINFKGAGVFVTEPTPDEVVIDIAGALVRATNYQTSDYTLQPTDNGLDVVITSPVPVIVTVPAGLVDSFGCSVIQGGVGTITVNAAPGVFVTSLSRSYTTQGLGAGASLISMGTDTFSLSGQLTPPLNGITSINGHTEGIVTLAPADIPGSVLTVNGVGPDADGNIAVTATSIPSASAMSIGGVQLVGALGGTANNPTALGYASAAALAAALAGKAPMAHAHTATAIGLGNVANLAPADLPLSNATVAALGLKASTDIATPTANGLMSAADKAKLDGSAGYTDDQACSAVAAALTASATLTASYNPATNTMALTVPDATSTSSGLLTAPLFVKLSGLTDYTPTSILAVITAALSAGTQSGIVVSSSPTTLSLSVPAVTSSTSGLMLAADKVKLDTVFPYTNEDIQDIVSALFTAGTHTGITVAYDDVSNRINLSVIAPTVNLTSTIGAAYIQIDPTTGAGTTLPAATTTLAGVMTAADKSKLDAIAPAATAYSDEQAQDAAALLLTSGVHSGITVAYDDASNRVNLTVPASALATTVSNGLLSAGDKVKLDGVAAGATAFTYEDAQDAAASLLTTGVHSGVTVTYDDAANRVNLVVSSASNVTTTSAGLMLAADKVKLDGLTPYSAATSSSSGLLTAADKTKLDGLTQYTDEQAQDAAAAALAAGTHTGITVSYNDGSGTISLTSTANGTTNIGSTPAASTVALTSSSGTGVTLTAATTSLAGVMTAADKTKLDGVATGANLYTDEMAQDTAATMIVSGTHTSVTATYNDASGTLSLAVPAATTTTPGTLSATDKSKLDGIATGATVFTTEMAQDAAAAALVAGTHTGITITYDDTNNKINLSAATASTTNLGASYGASTVALSSSTGTGVTLTAATTAAAGLMSATDKTKLDDTPAFVSAAAAPASPVRGQRWYNTSDQLRYEYDGAVWVQY